MANTTLEDILLEVGAYVDQDPTLTTGTELRSRAKYADQAQQKWANSYEWDVLKIKGTLSFSFSGTSVGLPGNFKRLLAPIHDQTENADNRYIEIDFSERYNRDDSDKYCYVTGNRVSGFALNINPAMASGVSLSLDYESRPSSLATLADIVTCPDAEYITNKTIGYVLAARSDPRFPSVNDDARESLLQMIEAEDTPSGGEINTVPTWPTGKIEDQFVMGQDEGGGVTSDRT